MFRAGRSERFASSRYRTPASKTTSTTTPSSGAPPSISVALEALVGDLKHLDRDLVRLRVQRRPFPLARPAVAEVPAHDFGALVVGQDDPAVSAVGIAVDDRLPPVPELAVL